MGFDNVNVNVGGPMQPSSTYKTKVLKGNHSFASQITEPNMKYVIKHNFDLGGESVTIPENCVLEFDGGSLSNGTIVGQDINITGIYKDAVNVFVNGIIITEDFILGNTTPEINASKIEACRYGISLDDTIRIERTVNVYTDIEGSGKILIGSEPSINFIRLAADGIKVSGITIEKPMPESDVEDVMYSRVIHSSDHSNLTISSCKLSGAIKISGDTTAEWGTADYISNICILNNTFDVDFTHLTGNIEDDVIMLIGCRNSIIEGNNINAKNVNRVFKLTGIYKSEGSGAERIESTYNDIDEVVVRNNYIHSYCDAALADLVGTGKQVVDLYCNPISVEFSNNVFDITNHVSIIENKSVQNPHVSIIRFIDNTVKTNSCFTWICDKLCILEVERNIITFTGDYYGIYNPFRIMAINRLNVRGNNIKENLLTISSSVEYIVLAAYASTLHSTIFNSFYNAYTFDISDNIIELGLLKFVSVRTYDNSDTSLHDYDKLGDRNAAVYFDKNVIKYISSSVNDTIITINNITTIDIEGNYIIDKSNTASYAVISFFSILDNTFVNELNNTLKNIRNVYTTSVANSTALAKKLLNPTLITDGFRYKALNRGNEIYFPLSGTNAGMHVFKFSNFARNIISIETTNTGTTKYKIIVGVTSSSINVLKVIAGGGNVVTAEVKTESSDKILIVRQYAKGTYVHTDFVSTNVRIKGLYGVELPSISTEVRTYAVPDNNTVISYGISDNPLGSPDAFADRDTYIANIAESRISGCCFKFTFNDGTPGIFTPVYGYQRLAGPTAKRPQHLGTSITAKGFQYFDTDLNNGAGMPIWWNGTTWINATGASV